MELLDKKVMENIFLDLCYRYGFYLSNMYKIGNIYK